MISLVLSLLVTMTTAFVVNIPIEVRKASGTFQPIDLGMIMKPEDDAFENSIGGYAISSSSSSSASGEEIVSRGTSTSSSRSRRQFFSDVVIGSASAALCGCCAMPHAAYGLAQITSPAKSSLELYDLPRNKLIDAAFARGMANGMVDYEKEASTTKTRLFQTLFDSLAAEANGGGSTEPVVVEVGMGSFPNAKYYPSQLTTNPETGKVVGLDIIGVDPNDKMESYARDSAKNAGLLSSSRGGNSLRIVHGVSEALPFKDNTVDAVVCTLTLCSVVDPEKSVAEIKRVLKPGGKFLFWEHVLSQTDPALAATQHVLTPTQVKMADGCHLDRRTGDTIKQAGFEKLDLKYIELKGFQYLNPTVCGIATA